MYRWRVVIWAALLLFFQGFQVFAQDITLKSRDGEVAITGTLLGFDGEFYRVETIYGELTVDGSGVLCDGPACPSLLHYVADVSISGAYTMAEVLMPALIEAFGLRHGYAVTRKAESKRRFAYILSDGKTDQMLARFHFHTSSSDEGFADLLAGEADIAMSLREIREGEAKRGYAAGLGDMTETNRSRVLSLDGLVAVVSPGNPVRSISPGQLAQIFAGEVESWAEFGGPDAPISLHLLDGKTGIAQAVEDQLMKPSGYDLVDGIVRYDRNDALVAAVVQDAFAIGIAPFSETGNAQTLVLRGACGFALSASRRTIKTEDYPLTAPMFLYFPARRLPKIAREFLTYTRSPSAQVVIRRAGFVDQTPEEIPVELQGDRFVNAISVAGDDLPLDELQDMAKRLAPMKRLTTSFRFRTGETKLDAQSRSNVQQLARAIEGGFYDGRKITFVGFSDGVGPAEENRTIAEKRAEIVKEAVVAAAETANLDQVALEIMAFGEALPMACDDSAWGRQVNRRVEIWVR